LRGPLGALKRAHKKVLNERIDTFEHGAASSNPSLEHVHDLVLRQRKEAAALRLRLNQNRIARARKETKNPLKGGRSSRRVVSNYASIPVSGRTKKVLSSPKNELDYEELVNEVAKLRHKEAKKQYAKKTIFSFFSRVFGRKKSS